MKSIASYIVESSISLDYIYVELENEVKKKFKDKITFKINSTKEFNISLLWKDKEVDRIELFDFINYTKFNTIIVKNIGNTTYTQNEKVSNKELNIKKS